MESERFIREYLTQVGKVAESISMEDVDRVIEVLFEAWKGGRWVFTCGNGGSASTATHFACDLAKTVAPQGKRGFKAECLNDNIPLMLALINDEGFDNLFYEQIRTKFQPGDVLICISVHGGAGADKAGLWSQNLLKAMRYAQQNGGKAIGLSGFDGGPMKEIADACIVVPADSTPLVESFHLVLEHLIVFGLKEKLATYEVPSALSEEQAEEARPPQDTESGPLRRRDQAKAVFLDRDGVINELVYYQELGVLDSPFTPGQFRLLPGVGEAIGRFREMGYRVVLVSNQPGMAKGHLSQEEFEAIRAKMSQELAQGGAFLDGEYYCFHHPEAKLESFRVSCSCRKPEPGLILRAAREMDIDLSQSWMIGDGLTDIEAGRKAGCRTVLLGRMKCELCHLMDEEDCQPDLVTSNLLEAATRISHIQREKMVPFPASGQPAERSRYGDLR